MEEEKEAVEEVEGDKEATLADRETRGAEGDRGIEEEIGGGECGNEELGGGDCGNEEFCGRDCGNDNDVGWEVGI